jgi:hypothetical protein
MMQRSVSYSARLQDHPVLSHPLIPRQSLLAQISNWLALGLLNSGKP